MLALRDNGHMPRIAARTVAEHRQQRTAAILGAATAQLARGLTVSMTSVATAAGLPRSSIYEYYPDAEAIIMAARSQRDRDVVDAAIAEYDGHNDRVETACDDVALSSYVRSAVANAHLRVDDGEDLTSERERLGRVVAALCIALREGVSEGEGEF